MIWSACASAGSGGSAFLSAALDLSTGFSPGADLSPAAGFSAAGSFSDCAQLGTVEMFRQQRAPASMARRERWELVRRRRMTIRYMVCAGGLAANAPHDLPSRTA